MAAALLLQVYGSHMFREKQNTKARQKKRTMEGLDYAQGWHATARSTDRRIPLLAQQPDLPDREKLQE